MRKLFLILIFIIVINSVLHSELKFNIGRVKYSGGGDWYGDPTSLPNVLKYISDNTVIKAGTELTVELKKNDLYQTPFLYLTGHGNIKIPAEDAQTLREYLINGGFLYIDDNYGLDEFIRKEMKKVFPEKEFVELDDNHEIFNIYYKFKGHLPKIHKHHGGPPHFYAVLFKKRVVVFYSYNTDIGDGCEDFWVHQVPEKKRQQALRMYSNVIIYSMLH